MFFFRIVFSSLWPRLDFDTSLERFLWEKTLYKNLNFFDKIFVRRRFCNNTLYGGKVLLMGKCFVWAHGFDKLVYALICGGDTKFKLPKAGNGNVFFLASG